MSSAEELASEVEKKPRAKKDTLTVVLAVTREATDDQIICWMSRFHESGTELPVAIIHDRGSGLEVGDVECVQAGVMRDKVETGPGEVSYVELLMAQAYKHFGPCFVMRPESLPLAPLDELAKVDGKLLMATDPARRTSQICAEELAAGVMLARTDILEQFLHWWKISRGRVDVDGTDSRGDKIRAANFGQVILSMIYHAVHPMELGEAAMMPSAEDIQRARDRQPRLEPRWCYSRLLPKKPCSVLWVHGDEGKRLTPDFVPDPNYLG